MDIQIMPRKQFTAPRRKYAGRPKQFAERVLVKLVAGSCARMDAALDPKENRVDLIRSAIDRELKRRAR